MAKAYQIVTTRVLTVEDVEAIKKNPYKRLFTIVYGRPPDKPDVGMGRAVPWKRWWERVHLSKEKDGGARFLGYLSEIANQLKPGAAGRLQSGFLKMRAISEKFAHVKGPAEVYKGKVYNKKHIAMMESKEKGHPGIEPLKITPKSVMV